MFDCTKQPSQSNSCNRVKGPHASEDKVRCALLLTCALPCSQLRPPASGKSTLGENLASRFKGKHLDLGVGLRDNSARPPADLLVDSIHQEMEEVAPIVS